LGIGIVRSSAVALVTVGSMVTACGPSKPPIHSQRADVKVENDSNKPVVGASVLINGEAVGATRDDGRAELHVRGIAGDKFRVNFTCPEGYRPQMPDTHEIFVTPGLLGAAPELHFRCEATQRKAIVAVRAENGRNLPVRILGREVGRTDDNGAATIVVEAQEGEPFELVLDTSSTRLLHPQNPALTFHMGPKDSSFVFTQKFTIEKPKRVVYRPQVATRL
jgi:hypothetical protein